jgi:hypothetical protein
MTFAMIMIIILDIIIQSISRSSKVGVRVQVYCTVTTVYIQNAQT